MSSVTGESRVTVGSLSTGGGYSAGILGFSTYGNVTVAASGAIRTEGMVSDGVRASGRGVIDVSVHDVETRGESSSAVVAMGGEAHVAISGLVRTTGDFIRSGSGAYQAAIFASASSAPDAEAPAGTVTIVNDGAVETTGYHTAGIQALAERGVSIGGDGAVRTEGARANGIYAASRGAVSIQGGSVVTQGDDALGVVARAIEAIAIDIGAIETSGARAYGVDARTEGDIAFGGELIVTSGANGVGLFLTSVATEGVARMNVDLDLIETTGDHAFGVDAYSGQSDVALVMTGSVRTSGGYADGVASSDLASMSRCPDRSSPPASAPRASVPPPAMAMRPSRMTAPSWCRAWQPADWRRSACTEMRASRPAAQSLRPPSPARPSRQIPMTETSGLTLRRLRPAAFLR